MRLPKDILVIEWLWGWVLCVLWLVELFDVCLLSFWLVESDEGTDL